MKAGTAFCNDKNSTSSGKTVAESALQNGRITRPDLVIAFCSNRSDPDQFIHGIRSVTGDGVPVIGGSSIGIITNDHLSYEEYPSGALAVESDRIRVRTAHAGRIDREPEAAGRELAEKLGQQPDDRLLMLFYDSVAIEPTEASPPVLTPSSRLLSGIEALLPDMPVAGAGLLGDYHFTPARQFLGSHAASKSIAGTVFSGDFSHSCRIMHGCRPLNGIYHTITRMDEDIIYELDGHPVVEMIDQLYGSRHWQSQCPVNLLTVGVNCGARFAEPEECNYVNRLITGVLPDKSGIRLFEPDQALAEGTEIQFMLRDTGKMIESAGKNAADLMEQIQKNGKQALFALYIDCAGRTAAQSGTLGEEADEVREVCNRHDIPLLGFYSGVEIAPLLNRSRGLDWTGVFTVFTRDSNYE